VKLLLDQNLSPRLLKTLQASFPDSSHVRLIGLRDADDSVVWEYARQHDFVIVSKDSDFHQRSFVLGFPPKVIWIRVGNCPTVVIQRILTEHQPRILEFGNDQVHAFLALS
jgi:predicted nuclease of predicted toxin-antitoxin system